MSIVNQMWDFFSSVRLAIVTLCSLAITSIIGTIIPQGEALAFYSKLYGEKWAQFIHILDLDTMYYSWWFLGLLCLLSMNLIVCSLDRLPRVFRQINGDNLGFSQERLEKMGNHRFWRLNEQHVQQFDGSAFLKTLGWTVVSRSDNDGEMLFAEKQKWSRLGVYIVHLSILVIFAGAMVGHFLGFKGSVMIPELRTTSRIYSADKQAPIDLGFAVRCDAFGIEFYPNGMPKEYMSRLTILENDREVLTTDIEVNGPLTYKGITFYQASYEGYRDFVVKIAKVGERATVFATPFQEQMNWAEQNIQFGVLNAEAHGQRLHKAKLWFKVADSPAVLQWVDDNAPTKMSVAGVDYNVTVKQMYATGLQVARDPGVWIVYLGCGLMILGLYMAFFMSHRRIWLYRRYVPGAKGLTGVVLSGMSNKNRIAFNKAFKDIEDCIDTELKKNSSR